MTHAIDRLLHPHQAALGVRSYRSQVLASNIANADTPGFQARDVDFKAALSAALGARAQASPLLARTSQRHMGAGGATGAASITPLIYRSVTQASIDNNSVDVNVERAQFADNAMRYEASLTFINSKIKGLLAAIQT
ncbi:MAG: flagellar basal body rod protein FlgB [Burkholderiales bacterium]|nr:flagellar basal body rod protein FlgB [Burkholderiales bacterium]